MKKLSIWQWVALGIAGAALVTEVVLVFVAPGAALWAGGAFVLGALAGYWLKKNNVQNAKENNAAKGSFTQMRAELKQMIKAYDNMSAEERKAADKGGALLKAIMEQTDAIKAAEYSTGRFSKQIER